MSGSGDDGSRHVARRPVPAGGHRRQGGDRRPAPRQHLDLGDHRRPRAAGCAGRRARTQASSATSGRPRISTASTRPAASRHAQRQGARRRHRRMAPLDRRQDRRPRRHPLAPRRGHAFSADRRRSTSSPSRLNILATVGSVAPFVGLFGTVWGIMRSFTDIAGANNTSLAVVAPGHRRGPVRDRARPVRGDPGGDRLQSHELRHQPPRGAAAALRRRLPRHASAASWSWRDEGRRHPPAMRGRGNRRVVEGSGGRTSTSASRGPPPHRNGEDL